MKQKDVIWIKLSVISLSLNDLMFSFACRRSLATLINHRPIGHPRLSIWLIFVDLEVFVMALSDKTNLRRAGGFVASPYDKTLPIQVHETWPGVPRPSRLGPWTGSQEPVHYRL